MQRSSSRYQGNYCNSSHSGAFVLFFPIIFLFFFGYRLPLFWPVLIILFIILITRKPKYRSYNYSPAYYQSNSSPISFEDNNKNVVKPNFCKNCGHNVEIDSTYCSECGYKLI